MCALLHAITNPDQLGGVTGFLVDLMNELGGVGLALAIALESVFPPIPSELVLPLAGFTASRPDADFSLGGAIAWSSLGSLIGALLLYWAGAAVGLERTRAITARMPLAKVSDIDRTMEWFAKHGQLAVFFGRMLPIFRSLVSLPAGVERMPLTRFIPLTLAGAIVWNSVLIGAGYQLGEQWEIVEQYAELLSTAVLFAIIVFLARITYLRLKDAS